MKESYLDSKLQKRFIFLPKFPQNNYFWQKVLMVIFGLKIILYRGFGSPCKCSDCGVCKSMPLQKNHKRFARWFKGEFGLMQENKSQKKVITESKIHS